MVIVVFSDYGPGHAREDHRETTSISDDDALDALQTNHFYCGVCSSLGVARPTIDQIGTTIGAHPGFSMGFGARNRKLQW